MADREKAIEDAETMRQTHVAWLEHLSPVGKGGVGRMKCDLCNQAGIDKIIGGATHQQECIDRYDNILAVLREARGKR